MDYPVHLYRSRRSDQGTEGFLIAGEFTCFTLELPWKDNTPNISCIPKGEYEVGIRTSPRYGKIYHVREVENRSWILIHSGNFAGDESKGYKTHVKGCILLGKYHGILENQRAVLCSRPTIRSFMDHLDLQSFHLIIHDNIL